jgi:hypothetical protein
MKAVRVARPGNPDFRLAALFIENGFAVQNGNALTDDRGPVRRPATKPLSQNVFLSFASADFGSFAAMLTCVPTRSATSYCIANPMTTEASEGFSL